MASSNYLQQCVGKITHLLFLAFPGWCMQNVSIFNCYMSATFTDLLFARQLPERIIVRFLFYGLLDWNNVYRI